MQHLPEAQARTGPAPDGDAGFAPLAAAFLETVDDGFYVIDRLWRFVYVNPGACAMWNVARETVAGRVLWERFPQMVGSPAGESLREAVGSGRKCEYENFSPVMRRWLWIRVYPLGGGLTGVHWRDVTERRRITEALRDSEERLKLALDAGHLGTWEIDVATGRGHWSDRLAAMVGREAAREGMGPEEWMQIVHPEDRDRLGREIAAALAGAAAYDTEFRILRPDGAVRWIANRGLLLPGPDGRPARLVGVAQDVTGRRQLEQDLRESEERYRMFAEAALEGVAVHDYARILDVSGRFAAMFGYRPEEMIGEPVRMLEALIAPEDVPAARSRVARRFDGFGEMSCVRKDGTRITVEYAARHLTYRGREVRLAIARDITERKRSEAALRSLNEALERQVEERARQLSASRARLRAFFDNSPDWLTLQRACADGRFVYEDINPTCEQAYGLPRDEVIGRTLEEVLGAEPAQTPLHHLREAVRTGRPQRYVAHRTMAGRTRTIDVMFVLVPGEVENGDRFIITAARDITEREELEEKLRHAQRMEAVGQLTGGVAHDFNNLLTAVISSLDMIAGAIEDVRMRRLAETALRSATRGARLTQQLLSFARRQTLRATVCDLNALLIEMETLLRGAVGEAVQVALLPAPDLWPCEVDPAQFEAAMMNLVVNARDAMPGGGQLTLATANFALADGAGLDLPAGDYVELSVADTGSGMSPEVLRRAFEPFFTTKEIGKGSGLGLSMVHGFARQSGGAVHIDSGPGAGTVVRLLLPRAAAGARPSAEGGREAIRPGSGRILLVEDDEDVREIVTNLLGRCGYDVVPARTATEALGILRRGAAVDLLLSDVVMPGGITGVELAREARRLKPHVAVLLSSGYAAGRLPMDDGAFPFIAKPYRPAELVARVRDLLAGARSQES